MRYLLIMKMKNRMTVFSQIGYFWTMLLFFQLIQDDCSIIYLQYLMYLIDFGGLK